MRPKDLYRLLHPRFQALFLEYHTQLKPRYGHGAPAHPELLKLIQAGHQRYLPLLQSIPKYSPWFDAWPLEADPKGLLPHWNNGFLPGLDMVGLFALLAEEKPKLYVEIGSGNSTRIAHQVKKHLHPEMRLVSIDPMPRAEIDALADEVVRKRFEDTHLKLEDQLEAGDVLFIDNSHRILPNSDATVFFLEVLPRLKPGVWVHIHDIYLPYDYPPFMCERFYSEQYPLACCLLANPERFQVWLPNYYISENQELASVLDEFWKHPVRKQVEKHGGAFWLKMGQL